MKIFSKLLLVLPLLHYGNAFETERLGHVQNQPLTGQANLHRQLDALDFDAWREDIDASSGSEAVKTTLSNLIDKLENDANSATPEGDEDGDEGWLEYATAIQLRNGAQDLLNRFETLSASLDDNPTPEQYEQAKALVLETKGLVQEEQDNENAFQSLIDSVVLLLEAALNIALSVVIGIPAIILSTITTIIDEDEPYCDIQDSLCRDCDLMSVACDFWTDTDDRRCTRFFGASAYEQMVAEAMPALLGVLDAEK